VSLYSYCASWPAFRGGSARGLPILDYVLMRPGNWCNPRLRRVSPVVRRWSQPCASPPRAALAPL